MHIDPATIVAASTHEALSLPLFLNKVEAGFPSPADDYQETSLDLNEHLIQHKAATFFVRAKGTSMIGAGIHDGDLLIVDRALRTKNKSVVLAIVDGQFTVKRLITLPTGQIELRAENPDYPSIAITQDMEFEVWGVLTNVIHALR